MKSIVVIGSNYGDEAKGAYTDFFASQNDDSIVIRFNGGAQAGHTVQHEEVRHVFSHFGSGSLAGRPTYLSEFFVNHPMLFIQEWDNLASKFITPKVYVHPNSLVTTPWDMLLNQLKEKKKQKYGSQHGSVGVGFGETIERNLNKDFQLKVQDLNCPYLLGKLRSIKNIYFKNQIEVHELEEEFEFFKETSDSPFLEERFLNDIKFFLSKIIIWNYSVIDQYKVSIFEGAQGLLLDMNSGVFPHVTRSNTGLTNVLSILKQLKNVSEVDVYYLSRSYLSRHGAGELKNEVNKLQGIEVVDPTNKPHEYQGSLRFAPLYHSEFFDRIDKDFITSLIEFRDLKFAKHVCFSCLDQIKNDPIFISEDGLLNTVNKELYINYLEGTSSYCSYGPTRNDIKKCN
jgi:adenylosuccinate synthase